MVFYDRKKFFDGIRSNLVPTKAGLSQTQVAGFEKLISEGEKRLVNTEWISYVLATAWHETAFTMQPVRETLASNDQQAIDRLNNAYAAGKLGQVKDPYWRRGFFGRGYVQLTHESNYKIMGTWLGVDLVNQPSLALDADIAVKIIYEGMLRGMFTVKKLSTYLDGVIGADPVEAKEFLAARAIINGKDKAELISSYALKIEHALHASEIAMVSDVKVVEHPDVKTHIKVDDSPVTPGNPPQIKEPKTAAMSTTVWTAIGGLGTTMATTFVSGLSNPIVQIALLVVAAGFAWWIIKERMKGHNVIEGLF